MGTLTPEGKIKHKVKEILREFGVWYFLPGNNGMGRSGIPDFVCIVNGQFVGIECKADEKKVPTLLQIRCGEEIKAAGGRWVLVRSGDDLVALRTFLRLLIKSTTDRRQHADS